MNKHEALATAGWRSLLRSHAFRLALLHASVFGSGVALLLGFLYWSTAGFMSSQADQTIAAEIEGLAEQYLEHGLEGLNGLIAERIRRDPRGESVYLFASPDYRALAGNLDRWPKAAADEQGWIDFTLQTPAGSRSVRARSFVLSGGLRLLVGRDVHSLEKVRTLVHRAIAWGLAITVALAIAGGAATSRATLRRIEAINQTSREIMAGDLGLRVPTSGSGDDFDQLAGNLNAMLDEIETLMASVRDVSDNVAHDLRTPLTRLRHRLETLKSSVDGDSEAGRLVEAATDDVDQLLSAFTALLRIARLEAGQVVSAFEPLELGGLADDAYDLYEAVAESRGLSLKRRIMSGCVINADRDLLFQALGNLLENALKFTPPSGDVTIEVVRRGEQVLLAVADTGLGVPKAQHEQMFERFFRGERSRTTPGHGLGLSLVAAVARHHGASVDVYDNEPGLTVALRFSASAAPPAG
ncbi:MAG: HAMP domain-containing protein [Gammaproteobacteria bacterium]|nr:HAMP domain-containing protein [Gammaproteobacteria bacterium]